MRNAAHKAREKYPDLPIEGELQFVARYHQELQEQSARILPLPDMQIPLFSRLSMPEISDTRLHRDLGNFEAYGPILLGLNAPINDLSRGCNASEVYSMAIITAALA